MKRASKKRKAEAVGRSLDPVVLCLNPEEALLLRKAVGGYSLHALERFQYMAQNSTSNLYTKEMMDSAWNAKSKADALWKRIDDAMSSQNPMVRGATESRTSRTGCSISESKRR